MAERPGRGSIYPLPTSTNNNDNSNKRGLMFAALVQELFDNFIMCMS